MLDKTGTVTTGRMSVTDMVADAGPVFEVTLPAGSSPHPRTAFTTSSSPPVTVEEEPVHR
ncbi:MAG: hypothetical protein ABJA86_13640 [Nocardioidaceae bacterium]